LLIKEQKATFGSIKPALNPAGLALHQQSQACQLNKLFAGCRINTACPARSQPAQLCLSAGGRRARGRLNTIGRLGLSLLLLAKQTPYKSALPVNKAGRLMPAYRQA